MSVEIINNAFIDQPAGFTQNQFRKLDSLFTISVMDRRFGDRAVDCDFDAGIATYTYYLPNQHVPYLQFVIRKVGPRTTMYEVYKQGKGRIAKSGVFDRAYEKLNAEVESIL